MPTTPLRLYGTNKVEAGPSPTIGQYNAEIYGGRLDLSPAEIAELKTTRGDLILAKLTRLTSTRYNSQAM